MRQKHSDADIDIGQIVEHPILPGARKYFIAKVEAEFDPLSQNKSSLSLTFLNESDVIRLRFTGVRDLEVDAGFPYRYSGLMICDISHLGWEATHIRVTGEEQDPGIRFLANTVERID
jgi:hypothetical protein